MLDIDVERLSYDDLGSLSDVLSPMIRLASGETLRDLDDLMDRVIEAQEAHERG